MVEQKSPIKKRVIAYYDGSNFYHHCLENYGIKNINFFDMTNQLLDLDKEELIKIKYFNSPVSQQEDQTIYGKQQRFFDSLNKTPLTQVLYGRLVKRGLNSINITCLKCGHQKANYLKCPICDEEVNIKNCFKYIEKGVDVKLAITLLLDFIQKRCDMALLFSGDADFAPAVRYVVKTLKKEVVYCYFPTPKTSELIQTCSDKRLITKEMVENSQLS